MMHDQRRQFFWTVLSVVIGCGLALYATLKWMPVVHVGDVYLPVSHDSFYHARRILDAVADPSAYYQFDPRIHVPDGSWLPWPWAYDRIMAWMTRFGMWLTGTQDPMAVLVVIPPLMSVINVALIAGISRRMGLSAPLQLLAVVCYALLPLTQGLHGVGILDHHYIEQTFVLLTLYLGLAWFSSNMSSAYGMLLGVALGCATAFHNGLFVLQMPVLLAVGILWLRKVPEISEPRVAVFSLALLAATLLFLLPSEPFRLGYSSYYIHSWFHLYIAGCTSLIIAYTVKWRFSWRSFSVLLLLVVLMLVGISQQINAGVGFVSSDIEELRDIVETESVIAYFQQYGIEALASVYTWLVVLLPVVVLWYLLRLLRSQDPAEIFLSGMLVSGVLLLFAQWRMHYFGSYALFLPVLLLAQNRLNAHVGNKWVIYPVLLLAVGSAYLPAVDRLLNNPLVGRSPEYGLTRAIYTEMEKACKANPGVVLAGHNDGHYITFHTDCSVIANNFIISPLHSQKIRESDQLLAGTADDIIVNESWIRYVYVNRMDDVFASESEDKVRQANAGLREELLLPKGDLPEGYTLLSEVLFAYGQGGRTTPLARFFRIER
jgi:hypothetical protein